MYTVLLTIWMPNVLLPLALLLLLLFTLLTASHALHRPYCFTSLRQYGKGL
jgi:hypothetical protein